MSKRGKTDLVSLDRADSPAPIRRSTRISLSQNLPSSPAPMAIKTRRGSANSSSEEKITVEPNISPKEKRKTRRTSTDEEPKPAPLRSRRGSVSKVIEEEKASIPNSPGRRSTRLSSSSPSLDLPARRTRSSSQDTETVEIPARRTTRRSSTGVQETTTDEIVEKTKPVTRRRRSSSIDEQEENAKAEISRPKTKRLFNEDNHLEPIKEQEIKEKIAEEEKHENTQKLEDIQEKVDDKSEKIIEDLKAVLAEKYSSNESMSKTVETEKCHIEMNNDTEKNHKAEEKSSPNETLNKTIKNVDEESSIEIKEQCEAKEIAHEEDNSASKDTTSNEKTLLDNSSNEINNGKDNSMEESIIQQKNVLKIDEDVSYTVTVNDSCDIIKFDKKLNDTMPSPGSDKENTSINIKRKRLSIKKLEEISRKENAERKSVSVKSTPSNSICEPMDVDDDEDDLFSTKLPTKNKTPKKLGLNGDIGQDDEKLESGKNEISEQNGDVVNMNLSIKMNDSVGERSFSHVNSSPDKESSLLLDESMKTKTRESSSSSILNENKLASTDIGEIDVDDDCESDASIKLVDTDDELEAAKLSMAEEEDKSAIVPDSESMKSVETDNEVQEADSTRKEDKSVIASETSYNKTNITDSELSEASFTKIDTDVEEKVIKISTEKEDENKSDIISETSADQTVTIPDSELIETSMQLDITNVEADGKVPTENEEDESLIIPETSTSETIIIDSGLNESVLDESFDSIKTNSLTDKKIESNESKNTDSVEEEHKESSDKLDSEAMAGPSNETSTSAVLQKDNESPDLDVSQKDLEDSKTVQSKRQSEGKKETDRVCLILSPISSSAEDENHTTDNEWKHKSSTEISLNKSASLDAVDATDEDCVDMENTEIIKQSPHKCRKVNSRESLPKSKECKDDVNNIKSLNSSDFQKMAEPNSANNDSKCDISMGSTDKELKDVSQEEVIADHCLNISKASDKLHRSEIKDENEVSYTVKPNNSNENDISLILTSSSKHTDTSTNENVDINKIEEQECNVSQTQKSPSKKIILQKIEIVNISDVKIQNLDQSSSSTQSATQETDTENVVLENDENKATARLSSIKSSTRRSLSYNMNKNDENSEKTRNSLPNTKINIEEKASKSETSTTCLQREKIPTYENESENEINLISSDDEEILIPKAEEKSRITNYNDAGNSTKKKIKPNTLKSSGDLSISQKEESDGSEEETSRNKKIKVVKSNDKKANKIQGRIEIMQRSGIDVEDEDSSTDELGVSNELIDDMAEEVNELSEEESDENEIKDIGESVLSSDSDEESSEDDYDLDDPFIDNDEQEELLSGEEYYQEDLIEKPKKKYKRIIQVSSNTSDDEICNEKPSTESPKESKSEPFQVEEIVQAGERAQTRKGEFKGMIDSILKLSPGECSTPNKNISNTLNSSQITESSVILQETCSVGAAKSRVIIDKIQGVVDVFCKNINEPEGDISLNVSLNYKPPSNHSSARNSLSTSFGNKDLDHSIKNSPRLSLNERRNKASLSPQRRSCEFVKIEDLTEKENTEVENTKEEDHKNEHPIRVEEETGVSKKKKRSRRKKAKKEEDSSVETQKDELPTEKSDLNKKKKKAVKRPAEQKNSEAFSESQNSQAKQKKKEVKNDSELFAPPPKKKNRRENKSSDMKKNEISCGEAAGNKTKNVEFKESKNDIRTKNNTEKKLKRARDVSESTIERKKVKYNEPSDIVTEDLQPTEKKKKSKSEKREEKTQIKGKNRRQQINEVVTSKTNKTDEKQSRLKTTNLKEIKPKRSESLHKKSENVASSSVEYKMSNGNDHDEWDEEDIFVKPSAANNIKSGFNLEKCVERDFKNRMIYDSMRNKREPFARPKRH